MPHNVEACNRTGEPIPVAHTAAGTFSPFISTPNMVLLRTEHVRRTAAINEWSSPIFFDEG